MSDRISGKAMDYRGPGLEARLIEALYDLHREQTTHQPRIKEQRAANCRYCQLLWEATDPLGFQEDRRR